MDIDEKEQRRGMTLKSFAVARRLWTQNHHGMLAVHLYDHWLAQVPLLLSLGCLFGRISAHTMQYAVIHTTPYNAIEFDPDRNHKFVFLEYLSVTKWCTN